ncbi:hypothetical protein [Micromonospora sp. NPDC092111]
MQPEVSTAVEGRPGRKPLSGGAPPPLSWAYAGSGTPLISPARMG